MCAGMGDGTLTILDANDPVSGPRHCMVVGSGPVRCCVCVMGELWVGCEGSICLVDPATYTVKVCTRYCTMYITCIFQCNYYYEHITCILHACRSTIQLCTVLFGIVRALRGYSIDIV